MANQYNAHALYDMDSFVQKPLDFFLKLELEAASQRGRWRQLRCIPEDALDLASNDYLGLARHPEVIEAVCAAVREFGAGARASRLVSGHTSLHEQLESELAAFKNCEAALVFPSGYHANLSLISALTNRPAVSVFCDKRNHASLIDACSTGMVRYFKSLDTLRGQLERERARFEKWVCEQSDVPRFYTRRLIVTDGVFSMDGDLCDLPALLALAHEFDAHIVLDDAHGTGVLGSGGRGTTEHFGVHDERILHVGTLSKALGSQGGFVAGSRVLIDWLINTARTFIYTTGLAPASCGAALKALEIVQREPPRRARLREVTEKLANGLCSLGFEAHLQPSPIIPVIVGDAKDAVALSAALLERGVWCPAIRPPTVPANSSRLRLTASAALLDEEIDFALTAFGAARDALRL